jgi:hypothetical protein
MEGKSKKKGKARQAGLGRKGKAGLEKQGKTGWAGTGPGFNRQDWLRQGMAEQAGAGTSKAEQDRKAKREKEVKIAVFCMLFVIIAFFVFLKIYKDINKFEYKGLIFEKQKFGKIDIYLTKINIYREDGNFLYSLYLRNDPRKIESIPFNADIVFKKQAIGGFDPKVETCPDASLAAMEVGSFLSSLGIKVRGATTDENISKATGKTLASCENAKNITIILFKTANETKIYQQDKNCYIVDVANCKILEASERFILASILQIIEKSKELLRNE